MLLETLLRLKHLPPRTQASALALAETHLIR
jgi:hypothetical protein